MADHHRATGLLSDVTDAFQQRTHTKYVRCEVQRHAGRQEAKISRVDDGYLDLQPLDFIRENFQVLAVAQLREIESPEHGSGRQHSAFGERDASGRLAQRVATTLATQQHHRHAKSGLPNH